MRASFVKKKSVVRNARSYDNYGYMRRNVEVNRPTRLAYAAMGLATLIGAVLTVSDSQGDIFGDPNTAKSISKDAQIQEATVKARTAFETAFDEASPAGKFALQYLTESKVITRVRTYQPNNGNGLLGGLTGHDPDKQSYEYTFGDRCLDSTAYDIDGGNIEGLITGLTTYGVIEGDIPTAAAYAYTDEINPDVLTVTSGHADSIDLRFSGVESGSALAPLDSQTRNVLDTYGCNAEQEPLPSETVDFPSESSAWIKQ